jgi:hypothetical protein
MFVPRAGPSDLKSLGARRQVERRSGEPQSPLSPKRDPSRTAPSMGQAWRVSQGLSPPLAASCQKAQQRVGTVDDRYSHPTRTRPRKPGVV